MRDHEDDALGQAAELVLERVEVEEDGVALPAEQARRLVEDPARDAERTVHASLGGERELEWGQLEVGDGAEREPDDDLERRRRGEPGAGRQGRTQLAAQPDGRPAEERELRRDARDVAREAVSVTRPVRREGGGLTKRIRSELDRSGRLALEDDAEVDRRRQGDAACEVGELADQVDAARRPEAAPHRAVAHASCDSCVGSCGAASRRCHGWNFTVRRSIRCPSTESTVKAIPSWLTWSPGSAARPRRPKTKPATVW